MKRSPLRVTQDGALTARTFGEQDAEAGQSGRVELEELHVFERQTLAPDDAHAVAGEGVRVRGGLVDLAEAAGREDDRLRLEDMQFAGLQVVGDNSRRLIDALDLGHDDIQRVVLVVELDAELHAVLEERLQDHVTGAVGGVAGPANGSLAVVAGVAAEPALVDLALGRAVERQAHVLEVEHGVDRLLRENLGRILVDEVVAALHGVEGVPLPVVFFDVGERCRHAALRRTGVRPGRVELRDHRGAGFRARLDRGAHAGPAGTHDHDVVAVVVNAVDNVAVFEFHVVVLRPYIGSSRTRGAGWAAMSGHGSKIASTRVPSTQQADRRPGEQRRAARCGGDRARSR